MKTAKEYFDIAYDANENGEYQKARENYEKAIELKSDYAVAYHDLATLLSQDYFKEYNLARINYEKAIEIKPDLAEAYFNLALLLANNFKKYDLARSNYEKAIEVNPYYIDAYWGLAILLRIKFHENKTARKHLEKVIELKPDLAEAYRELSLVETFLNNREKANLYFEKYTELNISSKNEFRKNYEKQTESIDGIDIVSYYNIWHISVKEISSAKEIYFLGENADGKTILLQAICLAFWQSFIRNYADKSVVNEALNCLKTNPQSASIIKSSNGIFEPFNLNFAPNVFAYGVNRSKVKGKTNDPYGFMTLFRDDIEMTDPEEWLKELYNFDREGDTSLIPLENAKKILKDVLDGNIEITADYKEVKFFERGTELKLSELSDGYRSVMIWVCDLIAKFASVQPDAESTKDFEGVVMVDEIDLHLHPKWCYTIVKKLRTWFPKVQWIFTTHSENVVRGAAEDSVFYRLYKEKDEKSEKNIIKISEQFTSENVSKMMMNTISTSPLVGMAHARTRIYEEQDKSPDTSDNYWYMRISAIIDKRMKENPSKNYYSPDEIDQMIEKAIDELQNEAE